MGWINVLEAHYRNGLSLPVNLRFCFEGVEEIGSMGLNDYLTSPEGKAYFAGVTNACIVSNPTCTCTLLHGR
jgi:Cys-Gly metallodipeptidase DUG1